MKMLAPAFVLAATLTSLACSSPAERATVADDQVLALPLATVAETQTAAAIEAGGVVRARTTASVASRVLAPVTDVRVRPGDRVRRGQVLAVLDGREQAARAEAAAAALRSAEDAARAAEATIDSAAAEQKLAAATLTRISGLQARRSATAQELDQAAAAASAADARLAGARAAATSAAAARDAAGAGAEAARVASSYTALIAPFDGTVTARLVEPGAMASPGMPLLMVEDTSALQLEVTLDDTRAALVTPGATVDVQVGPDTAGWTTVRVVEVAHTDPMSHQFVVKASLPAGLSLRTGTFGRLRLSGPTRTALTIPSSSVVRRGQLAFAFVPDADGRARLRALSLAGSHDDRVEVLAGLSRGDRVVEAPPPDLTDGRRVAAGGPPAGPGASR